MSTHYVYRCFDAEGRQHDPAELRAQLTAALSGLT